MSLGYISRSQWLLSENQTLHPLYSSSTDTMTWVINLMAVILVFFFYLKMRIKIVSVYFIRSMYRILLTMQNPLLCLIIYYYDLHLHFSIMLIGRVALEKGMALPYSCLENPMNSI